MNFFQLFTTFLSLHKSPRQNTEFQSKHDLGHDNSFVNQDVQSNLLKIPVHQDHFDPFMKPENQFDVGNSMATTPSVLATPINNDFLKSIPFFNENIFGNNKRNGFDDRRGQRLHTNSNNVLNGRRDDQRRRNAGIIHRFRETNIVPTEIPAAGIPASDPVFSGITPAVNIDAILAGLHVAEQGKSKSRKVVFIMDDSDKLIVVGSNLWNGVYFLSISLEIPVRCNVKCGDSVHCPFGYLQEFCPRCRCAQDPCQRNPCFALDTCVAVPNQNCIDENFEMCPFEARCERIGCNCPAVWQPVCGTDRDLYSKTYVNYCAMTCVPDVTKIYDGECWPSHISRFFFAATSRPNRRSRPSAASFTMVTSAISNQITRISTSPDANVTKSSTLDPGITGMTSNSGTDVMSVSKTTVTRTTPTPPIVERTTTGSLPPAKNSVVRTKSVTMTTNNDGVKPTIGNKMESTVSAVNSKPNKLAERITTAIPSKNTKDINLPIKGLKGESNSKSSVLKETANDLLSKQVIDQFKAKNPKSEAQSNPKIGLGNDVVSKPPKDALPQDLLGFDTFAMDAEMASFDKMLKDLMMKKKQGGVTPP